MSAMKHANLQWSTLTLALALSACGSGTTTTGGDASAPQATAASDNVGIIIRARDGGQNPDRFCMPQWSIANRTNTDVGALLVELEWRTRGGQILEPAGELGSMVEPFLAGSEKDRSLNGYPTACSDLVLRVGRYACRNSDAVRIPCPAAISAEAPGGVSVDLSTAVEGSMRGAVEARP